MSDEISFEHIFGQPPEKVVVIPAGEAFESIRKAEEQVRAEGYMTGAMQAGAPMGFAKGMEYIGKWRNIHPGEWPRLDGIITGDFRNGPVTIQYRKKA